MSRRTLTVLLALTFGLSHVAGAQQSAPPAGAKGPGASVTAPRPPAAAAARSPRREQWLAWEKRTTVDAYDGVGHRDPKWDQFVKEALQNHYAKTVDGIVRTGDEEDRIWSGGRIALQAGCRDGLLQYVMARGLSLRSNDTNVIAKAHQDAAGALRDSKYPAFRKALAFFRAATYTAASGQEDAAKNARAFADEALALMPEVFADKDLPASQLAELASILAQAAAAYDGDMGAMGDEMLAALDASPQPPAAKQTGKGNFYVQFAWHARGSGVANTVTEEGWKPFRERIAVARASLEEAWKLDPTNADAAAEMITVEMASGGDRDAMEQWYGRAMKADPSCRAAATRKMTFLEPKWHGDAESMLAFGRELLAGGNWDAGLPLLLADAHWTLSQYGRGGPRALPDTNYFKRNPDAVWKDVKAVYEPYLKKVPRSQYHRTRYAVMAAWCGQWAEASRQFDELGVGFSRRVVPDQIYQQAVSDAEAHAEQDTGAAKEGAAPSTPTQEPALPF